MFFAKATPAHTAPRADAGAYSRFLRTALFSRFNRLPTESRDEASERLPVAIVLQAQVEDLNWLDEQ